MVNPKLHTKQQTESFQCIELLSDDVAEELSTILNSKNPPKKVDFLQVK